MEVQVGPPAGERGLIYLNTYSKRSVKPQKNTTVKSGFHKIQTPMVRRWLHELEPVNHFKNLGHPDHCVCFLRTQTQRIYVEGEILTIPPTQLMHAVVSCLTTFADRRKRRAPGHAQSRVEATTTRDIFKWIRDWGKAVGSGLL